jgi:hypothetical protein
MIPEDLSNLVAIFAHGVGQKERAQGLFNRWAREKKNGILLSSFFLLFSHPFSFSSDKRDNPRRN